MDILQQCQDWFVNGEYVKIIRALEAIPVDERTPDMYSMLALAEKCLADIGKDDAAQSEYASNAPESPEGDENDGSEMSLRYAVEHILLPRQVYEQGNSFVKELLASRGEKIMELYNMALDMSGDPAWTIPYKASDFRFLSRVIDFKGGSFTVISVKMPAPENVYDCRTVYICCDAKNHRELYFTSELNEMGTYFLCAWRSQDGYMSHLNFFEVKKSYEFARVIKLTKELLYT